MPNGRPGDYTVETFELFPADILDPGMAPETAELGSAPNVVLGPTHSVPPAILARCNLVLRLCRRLKSVNIAFSSSLPDQILSVTLQGIIAARTLPEQRAPWHLMANIPFQTVCIFTY